MIALPSERERDTIFEPRLRTGMTTTETLFVRFTHQKAEHLFYPASLRRCA